MHRLDDETTHLAGQVEQDLRQRLRGVKPQPAFDDLEDRLRECFETQWRSAGEPFTNLAHTDR